MPRILKHSPHVALGSQYTNQAREDLLEFIINEELIYAKNRLPTYYDTRCNILDMIFLNEKVEKDLESIEVMGDISSDHRPIKITCKDKWVNRNPKIEIKITNEKEVRRQLEGKAEARMLNWNPRTIVCKVTLEKEIKEMMEEWKECKERATKIKRI